MRIGGLFVGVDEHLDSSIPALKFAGRDALVLWALFADTNERAGHPESDTEFLVGRAATRAGVQGALDRLAACSQMEPYDFVHVHFSCHGLGDGRIVVADTSFEDQAASALPLSEITGRVAGIRSTTLVVTLDCCFAGTVRGMAESANATAFQAALTGIAGESRTVAWSSRPDEEALESGRQGHGLFSAGLILGLRTFAIDGDRVYLSRWIQRAMQYAADESKRTGRPQTPGAYANLSPDAWIPVPVLGRRFRRANEEVGIKAITPDPASLGVYDFDPHTIEVVRRWIGGGAFNCLQVEAVSSGGVLAGKNVVVRAPTSGGKTVVGELAVLRALRNRRKAVVLLPTRALVYQEFESFAPCYEELGFRAARSCGDVSDDDDLIRGNNFHVAFLTYEKFAGLAFARPQVFEALGAVIFDEVHQIGDAERGRVVELILVRVMARRRLGQPLQVVALCGPVDDLGGLEAWLQAAPVIERRRPLPLVEAVVSPSGRYQYRNSETGETGEGQLSRFPVSTAGLEPGKKWTAGLRGRMAGAILRALPPNEPTLVFRATRPDTRTLAREIAAAGTRQGLPEPTLDLLRATRAEDSRAARQLRACLKGGTAFHTRDLRRHERELVERWFRDSSVSVLVATTGLAMGVNTPASTVIVVDHEWYHGKTRSMRPLRVLDYRNMVGRAGRLGHTAKGFGTSYLLAEDEATASRLWDQYVTATGTRLSSGLGDLPVEDLVLALLALSGSARETDLLQSVVGTFYGFQMQSDAAWAGDTRLKFRAAVQRLLSDGFMTRDADGTLTLNPLGRVCGWDGLRCSSARRVLAAVRHLVVRKEHLDEMALLVLTQVTEELDDQWTPTYIDGEFYLKNAPEWFRERPALLEALRVAECGPERPERRLAERLKRTWTLRSWVDGQPLDRIEAAYGQGEEPATMHLQAAVERTGDLLRAIAGVAATVVPDRKDDIAKEMSSLRLRLEHGVDKVAGELCALALGLTRHEARQLAAAGIATERALLDAVVADDPRLHAALSTPGVHSLRVAIQGARTGRRRSRQSAQEQALLDLFPDGTVF
jgi:replicative superfamily II helicase